MADLLDIAPSTAVEIVQLGEDDGQSVEVRGITINVMAAIISRFPELKTIMSGNSDGNVISLLITSGAAVVGPVIAAGVGHFGKKEYEERAANLLPEQQMKLLQAIARLTFPNGISAFMGEVTVLINGADNDKPKTMRSRSNSSQSPLPASAETSDSPPIMQ